MTKFFFALTMALTAFADGASAFDAAYLQEARDNARAGGPVSEQDAELLQRYGCASGTDTPFCRKLDMRRWHHREHVSRRYR